MPAEWLIGERYVNYRFSSHILKVLVAVDSWNTLWLAIREGLLGDSIDGVEQTLGRKPISGFRSIAQSKLVKNELWSNALVSNVADRQRTRQR